MKVDDYGTGDFVRRAQKYVAASNEHDVAAIEDMLTLECEYISSGVGNHNGREVILGMMQGFFERFLMSAGSRRIFWPRERESSHLTLSLPVTAIR